MKVDSVHPMFNFSDSDVHLHNYHHHIDQDVDDVEMDKDDGGNSHSKAEIRKSNKPIMEKRRRARINNCLNDLKGILLEAMKKDPARHSKLEKADILELTVRHLQNVQRNQLAVAMATDPTVLLRFKNGFSECATEVSRYIGKLEGVDSGVRHRLSGHLGSCVNGLQQVGPFGGAPRYSSLGGICFASPPAVANLPGKPIVPGNTVNTPPSAIGTGVQVQLLTTQPSNNIPQPVPHHIEDVNNNNDTFPTQAVPSDNNSIGPNPQDVLNHPIIPLVHTQRISSAFTTVSRSSPTPQESPTLMSPPSSCSDSPNVSVSLSSGSDSSSCAGTTANISMGLSPIDFSLKLKDKERTVRVLKVEPMILYDDLNASMNKGSMWRPW